MKQPYVSYRPAAAQPRGEHAPAPSRRRKTFLLVLLAVAMSSFLMHALFFSHTTKAHGVAATSTHKTPVKPKPAMVDQAALAAQVNPIISDSSLEASCAIVDLADGQSYSYGTTDPFVAASTTKLLSAALYLHDAEQGTASLSEPLGDGTAQDEMQKMIVDSDNDAWESFNDLLGHDALIGYAHSLGLASYNPSDNTITATDLAQLLAKLYQGKLLNSTDTSLLLGYMKQAGESDFIEATVPATVTVYHKAGYLDDRAMDAAIIDNGVHPYALVIFTKDPSGDYDSAAGQAIFHGITTATLTTFAR